MARTAAMRLIELMILKEDINKVIEYLGKNGNFEFYSKTGEGSSNGQNSARDMFEKLQTLRAYLDISDLTEYDVRAHAPESPDFDAAAHFISEVDVLRENELKILEEQKRIKDAYTEALAFSNLKVSYSELEHLSFLSLRIGKIDPDNLESLQFSIGNRAVIIPLGEDKTRVLAAASRKARFALDTELKKFGFVPLEIPKDFKGIPDDVLSSLEDQTKQIAVRVSAAAAERKAFAASHKDILRSLLQIFSIGMQINNLRDRLEATEQVYRITGWIPASDSQTIMKALDNLTEGRVAIRQYQPNEVASVKRGQEQVPVKLQHGKLIKSFEGMVFSYGSPLYGTIDPTPFVAFFYTLLFGLMFGDCGQGALFLIAGLLMHFRILKIKGWNKYGLVFTAIGASSVIMGLLTGEFFANSEILRPFGLWVTGLFVGKERAFAPILELMPRQDTIKELFIFFGFTIGIGFVINSLGLVINFINNLSLKRYPQAFLGKTGLAGALFFWYVIVLAIRIAFFKQAILWYDWAVIGFTALGIFFASPLERFFSGHRPVYENGFAVGIIEGVVELYEVVSSYFSNTVSFLRVGAFALSHVVLGYIIFTMTKLLGQYHAVFGWLVMLVGNAIVIVLEGMIVAIQVIRLQYYEFFSKFFTETGKEFNPFRFKYREE